MKKNNNFLYESLTFLFVLIIVFFVNLRLGMIWVTFPLHKKVLIMNDCSKKRKQSVGYKTSSPMQH